MLFGPGHKIIDYRDRQIEFNLFGRNEYTVQYCGDEVWFTSQADAEKFIDEISEEVVSDEEPEQTDTRISNLAARVLAQLDPYDVASLDYTEESVADDLRNHTLDVLEHLLGLLEEERGIEA